MCEQCGVKNASFGDPEDRVKKWCSRCSKVSPSLPGSLHPSLLPSFPLSVSEVLLRLRAGVADARRQSHCDDVQ